MPYVRNPQYRIRVPRRRGMRGFGMGQDGGSVVTVSTSSGDYSVLSDGSVYDPNAQLVTDFSTLPNNVTNAINTALDTGQNQVASLFSNLTPSQLTGSSPAGAAPSAPGAAPQSLTSQLQQIANAMGTSANTALKLFQAAQGPSLVAGTNVLYNPATGQYYNPTTGQVVNPTGGTTFAPLSLGGIDPTFLLIGGLLIGGVFLISMAGHR